MCQVPQPPGSTTTGRSGAGPTGSAYRQSTSYPDEWSPDKNIAWKTPVAGRGHSSPIVWQDRIFLTTSIEGGKAPDDHKAPIHLGFDLKPGYYHADSVGADHLYALKVLAFDAKTGKPLWERTVYDGLMYDNRHRKNTYASSTMATDGKSVYAFFESAGLYAFDFDGKLLWKKSLGGIAKAGMGPGTSPVIFENLLILQCDQEMGDGSFIVALDRKRRQRSVAAGADDAAELGDAAHRAHAGARRDDYVGRRGGHRLRPAGPAASCGARTAPRATRFRARWPATGSCSCRPAAQASGRWPSGSAATATSATRRRSCGDTGRERRTCRRRSCTGPTST